MAFQSYKSQSKIDWGTDQPNLSIEQINTGALLRIADAAEKMAIRHTELINERDRLSEYNKHKNERIKILMRSNSALRGQITKLKKTIAAASSK